MCINIRAVTLQRSKRMNQQQDNAMSQIIANCWADETFKQTLIADPKATLTAAGYPVPVHLSINIIEDTNQSFTIVIPPNPELLSDEDLDNVAGGTIWRKMAENL